MTARASCVLVRLNLLGLYYSPLLTYVRSAWLSMFPVYVCKTGKEIYVFPPSLCCLEGVDLTSIGREACPSPFGAV